MAKKPFTVADPPPLAFPWFIAAGGSRWNNGIVWTYLKVLLINAWNCGSF
jgi:hypothetical protein